MINRKAVGQSMGYLRQINRKRLGRRSTGKKRLNGCGLVLIRKQLGCFRDIGYFARAWTRLSEPPEIRTTVASRHSGCLCKGAKFSRRENSIASSVLLHVRNPLERSLARGFPLAEHSLLPTPIPPLRQ